MERNEISNMKRCLQVVCTAVFILLCLGTMCFLQFFIKTDMSIRYIDWQSSVKIETDGSESSLDYTVVPQTGESFRLETVFPPTEENGNLVFETAGLELTVCINGVEVWHSSSAVPAGAAGQTQAVIPMPRNEECHVTMTCVVKSTTSLVFPPAARFVPVEYDATESYAYANFYGIPAGVTAAISLLVAGIFLLGVAHKKPDWSLIPLLLAASGLTAQWITKGMGYFFLNNRLVDFLIRREVGFFFILLLILFLAMNRQRKFWKYFGITTAVSFTTLLIAFGISAAVNGYLAGYIVQMFRDTVELGHYGELLYWITVWLTAVCAVISTYAVMCAFVTQRTETQALRLHNQLILDGYRAIESKMRASEAIRHEERHRIVALESAYKKGDYETLGKMLQDMRGQCEHLAQTHFSKNFVVNAILQDAAYRAARAGISFDATASVSAEIPISENELCGLLMNMLDNAIEAASRCTEKSFIRFKAEERNGFLAVKCENSFIEEPKQDKNGQYISTKYEKESHGFGLKLMNAVAEKYHSMLDIFISDENVFTVQTALRIPKK